MTAYRFRVVLASDPEAFWRDVLVGGNREVTELKRVINDAIGLNQSCRWFFGEGNEYIESSVKFVGSGGGQDPVGTGARSETVYSAAETTIDDMIGTLELAEGDRICYLYDYTATWRFFAVLKEIDAGILSRTPPTVNHEVGPPLRYPIRRGGREIVPSIRTVGLTRRFGSGADAIVAVEDLHLTVGRGEVFGFLGPNGAGKSTTINMLLGFLDPTEGRASVLGHSVTRESQAIRRKIGLLPDGFDVYENLTAIEHVQSAIETKGADTDAHRIIDRVGLNPVDARRPAGDYSKGMQQRLALAVALVGDPQLLILDEPTAGLDPKGVKLLREIIRVEADRGATVFFSSHLLSEVETVCDRVGILNVGRLVTVDTIENLRKELGVASVVAARVDPVPDGLAIGEVDGIGDVDVSGNIVRIECTTPGAKMDALRRLDELTAVEDIAIEDPSLETLFEEYTGAGSPGPADSGWGTGPEAGESV